MFNRKPFFTLARHIAWTCACALLFLWANQAYAETPDTITFSDGEQLAGKLISVLGGTVTFHSEVLGNVTVPLEKVKTMNTAHPFAAEHRFRNHNEAAMAIPPVERGQAPRRGRDADGPAPDTRALTSTRLRKQMGERFETASRPI